MLRLRQTYVSANIQTMGTVVPSKMRRNISTRVCDAVKAIALCHNVTPVYEAAEGGSDVGEQSDTEADQQSQQRVSYQASSPDEVCRYFDLVSVRMCITEMALLFCPVNFL